MCVIHFVVMMQRMTLFFPPWPEGLREHLQQAQEKAGLSERSRNLHKPCWDWDSKDETLKGYKDPSPREQPQDPVAISHGPAKGQKSWGPTVR
eukprot:c51700_g1_i1 orf=1-279(+)